MAGSKIWSMQEAIADLPSLLQAAEVAPQFISSESGRFTVTFQKHGAGKSADLLSTPGPLEKEDLGDV